ncbi:unnamed protein product [Rotaria sp. Silwood2]|nr:unnamed protein product [Rotaria sp. Silwood2]
MNNEYSKSIPIRPQLPLTKRHKRWNKNTDNDETEITVNKLFIPLNNSVDISSSNSSIIENVDDLMNSTISFQFNMTTLEVYSGENTTMHNSLLRQNLTELNQTDDQTTISIIENVLQDNKTDTNDTMFSPKMFNELIYIDLIDSQTFASNITDIYHIITNDKNESITNEINNLPNEFQTSSFPIMFNQTINDVEHTIVTTHLDYTTTSYNITNNNTIFIRTKTKIKLTYTF